MFSLKPTVPLPPASPLRLQSKLWLPVQTYRLDPERHTTIVTSRGMRLYVPPLAFKGSSGRLVHTEVVLRCLETRDPYEMIIAGQPTTVNDQVWETAGQWRLQAEAGGETLQLARPLSLELPLQRKLHNSLALRPARGSLSTTHPLDDGRAFNWQLLKTTPLRWKFLHRRRHAQVEIDELGWWCMASPLPGRRRTSMLSLRLITSVEKFDELQAYIVPFGANALIRMYHSRHGFSAIHVPDQLPARVIVQGVSRNQYFWGEATVEPRHVKLVYIELEPTTLPGWREKLETCLCNS